MFALVPKLVYCLSEVFCEPTEAIIHKDDVICQFLVGYCDRIHCCYSINMGIIFHGILFYCPNSLLTPYVMICRQAEIDAERIGVGVTPEAQSIFDALSKT